MQIYLAPWEWFTDLETRQSRWQVPNRLACKGLVDLRSLSQCGKAGGTPEGYGLFVYPDLQSGIGGYAIGTETDTLSTTAKEKITSALKLTKPIVASKPLGILWELLNDHADVSGLVRWRPLRPGVDLKLKLELGGFSLIREERFDPGAHPLVIPSLQEGYRKIRQECLAQGSQHYKKVLDAWEFKYKLPYQTFIPSDLPDEGKKHRSTTITESFPGSSDTLGGDLTWTETQNDWDNVSGEGAAMSNGLVGFARAESDLASDDHYAQAALVSLKSDAWWGPMARFAGAANTGYITFPYSNDNKQYLRKVVTGTDTDIATAVAITITAVPYKVSADGSTIAGFQDGTQRLSATDTAIADNLRTGMGYYNGLTDYFDNFQAGDLAAAFVPKIILM